MTCRPNSYKLLILWAWLAAAEAGAQPTSWELLPAEADTLAGINLESVRAAGSARSAWKHLFAQAGELAGLTRAVGFDLLEEASELLMASTERGGNAETLWVARGIPAGTHFEQAKARALRSQPVEGVEVLLLGPESRPTALWFGSDGLLLAGTFDGVRAALARRGQGAPTGMLFEKAAQLRAQHHVWGVSILALDRVARRVSGPEIAGLVRGELLEAVEVVSGGLLLGPTIQMRLGLESRTPQDAQSLAGALRFFMSLLEAHQASQESLKVDLALQGRTVALSVTAPAEDIERLLTTLASRGASGRNAEPPRPAAPTAPQADQPAKPPQ